MKTNKMNCKKTVFQSILYVFAICMILCGCSGKSSKTIIRMQKIEEGVDAPTTEAELKVSWHSRP